MTPSSSKTYRLAIVEDHELTRQGLEAMLSSYSDFTVMASAPSVPQLLGALGKKKKVDLVLLDLRLSDDSRPVENVEKIEELTPHIVVVSSLESPYLLRQVLSTSVAEVLSKTQPSEEIVAAIRRTLGGSRRSLRKWPLRWIAILYLNPWTFPIDSAKSWNYMLRVSQRSESLV
jgi:possible two-component system response regulator